jgi:hypothetical protein
VLGNWLTSNGKDGDERVALLAALNESIGDEEDHDFKIGPSYLMRPSIYASAGGFERVWRTQILPLLEEHHYGDGSLDLTLPPAELLAQIADLAHAIAPSERCDSVSLG